MHTLLPKDRIITQNVNRNFKFLKFEGSEMNISTTNIAIKMVIDHDLIMKDKTMKIYGAVNARRFLVSPKYSSKAKVNNLKSIC